MKKIWTKKVPGMEHENGELRIGTPSWTRNEGDTSLSIKYVYWKNERIPRTAPEVAEAIVPEMLAFLLQHGRVSEEHKNMLRTMLR